MVEPYNKRVKVFMLNLPIKVHQMIYILDNRRLWEANKTQSHYRTWSLLVSKHQKRFL